MWFPRVLAAAVAALAPALLAPGGANAAAAHFTACGQGGLECTTVDVPLDRTGATPGTVPLYVERLPSEEGIPRGVMFLIAGGPGQGSAHVFDLANNSRSYRNLFPGWTLVAFDNRGTGRSGLIDCPAFQAAVSASSDEQARLAAACAALI